MRSIPTVLLVLMILVPVESSARSFYRNYSNYAPKSHARLVTSNQSIVIRTGQAQDVICPPCPYLSKIPNYKPNWGTYEVVRFAHLRPLGYRMKKEACDESICCQPLRKDIIMRGIF